MSKFRGLKLKDHLRDVIGKIIQKEIEFPGDVLVTVTGTEVEGRLSDAKIFISVYPLKYGPEIVDNINKRLPYLQALLMKKLRMKPTPRIHFLLDRGEEMISKIEKILEKDK